MHIHCAQCNVLSAMCIVYLQSEFKIQFIDFCNFVDIDGNRTSLHRTWKLRQCTQAGIELGLNQAETVSLELTN